VINPGNNFSYDVIVQLHDKGGYMHLYPPLK
jgi:hypothetical protein